MKLFDGHKLAAISLHTWDGESLSPDFSIDFFDAGLLPYDEDLDAYRVDNVSYCLEAAQDWKEGIGDFVPDPDAYEDLDHLQEDLASRVVLARLLENK